MIRHRLLDAAGCLIAEFEHDGALPDKFEHRSAGKSRWMRYAGTEDGVRVYVEVRA
jgi:phosphomannomutase